MVKLVFTLPLLLFGGLVSAASREFFVLKSRDIDGTRLGIHHGKPTSIKKHPYLVAIHYSGSFLCAGSIISESWVISSGDCVGGTLPSLLTILAGSQDSVSGDQWYNVSQNVAHPSYGPDLFDYNFALLQITGKFDWSETVRSINLPEKAAQLGSKALIVGWGASKTGEDAIMKQGKMSVISLADCEKIYDGFEITFTDRMLCYYNKGKVTPCEGDWADPFTAKNVLYALFIAIATPGECTKHAYPAIAANVQSVVPWIQNVTDLSD